MKVKTYDSRKCVVTIEESKTVVTVEETGVTEVDFDLDDLEVKQYPPSHKVHKKKSLFGFMLGCVKWLVGAAISAIVGTYATGFFIG
ncbi:TPA: hypothetical protein ACGF2R_003598 [Vibrio cholerae]|uniref:hypothetical protein n=1 Tax=Vibrio TaxID=662 RepID=UPI000B5474A4|nr:hypothetical protein [Vibrio anguillarum]ASG09230.1 hypothetical protein CEQ50_17150 [Vibrio anguillarum]HAS6313814.1 hypothetical protein [Vibrio vulnificus]HDY7562982.1 hypothetical protein [Vibrio vulnificus]HDZ3719829.1 hypothetical protein [Vibrio cholerae]